MYGLITFGAFILALLLLSMRAVKRECEKKDKYEFKSRPKIR